jgi:hypothetical protein
MVTFKPQGRLGNWLFCVATAIAYGLEHGFSVYLPGVTNDQYHNPIYSMGGLPTTNFSDIDRIIVEQQYYRYDKLPFDQSYRSQNILLRGYFQNPKYFQDYRKEIIETLGFQYNKHQEDTVSVHVRRGDYLTLQHKHPLVTKEWYENAMDLFKGKEFYFFSDDIEWCQREFGGRKDCSFSVRQNELTDLQQISQCEHHINSASTFSWWGAWLNQNPNKKVIVPKRWLTESHSNEWTEEIVPKEWIRI